ncbi:MAG: carboxypeptidase-like regulatory domain-containing protein [Bacteroidia bacterium]|nr:carboxypeptidase-like regulatory domain-containing protein [Bacteroidia bacterium]
MKQIILIALLFVSINTQAQTTLKCTLLDSTTNEPLEYINVGIPNKGVGTVSNEQGLFTLSIPDSLSTEFIKISAIGYATKTIRISQLKTITKLYLATQSIRLKDVVIKPHTIKQTVLGNKTTSQSMTLTSRGENLGWEIATFLNIKHKQTYLKTLKVSIVNNPYTNAKYRINIYAKDNKGNIGENILKQPITGIFPAKSGVIEIDLTKYNMYVDEDVFVAIEQISMYESGKKQISFSAKLMDKIYFRVLSQGSWNPIPIGMGMWVEAEY